MSKLQPTPQRLRIDPEEAGFFEEIRNRIATLETSVVLQIVEVVDGEVATGTTVLPNDDTIPQNTEGDEYMTLSITPKSSSSRLMIEALVHMSHTANFEKVAALFIDSTSDALAAGWSDNEANVRITPVKIFHEMASPGTGTYTFKARAGGASAGTTTFNGVSGSRRLGGVLSSYIKITEYLP